MNKVNVKIWALIGLLCLGVSNGFAQEDEEIVIEEDATSMPVETGEETVPPAVEDESYDFSEEEY